MEYRYRTATYRVAVANPGHVERDVQEVRVDWELRADGVIRLADDGRTHEVQVVLG